MISTEHVINFDELLLTDKYFFTDWEYLICEHDGHYSEDLQTLTFDYKGIEIVIGFDLTIRGWHWYRPSTYMEPEEGEVHITDVDIDVTSLSIADEEVVLDKNLKRTLTEVVKKYVKDE